MPVYFIQAGESGPVKIGWADHLKIRMNVLQVAHYEVLRLIREIEGDTETENCAHLRFRDLHIRGEWFRFHPEMMTVTPDELAVGYRVGRSLRREWAKERRGVRPPGRSSGVIVAITAAGGVGALARALGIDVAAVSRWRDIPEKRLSAIEQRFGLAREALRPDLGGDTNA